MVDAPWIIKIEIETPEFEKFSRSISIPAKRINVDKMTLTALKNNRSSIISEHVDGTIVEKITEREFMHHAYEVAIHMKNLLKDVLR